jgi:hypothetical protein
MRALKSVLVMAGSLKRANPDLPEDIVLIRAMRDSNLPKFLLPDVELFSNIIGDLFPGVSVPDQVGRGVSSQHSLPVGNLNPAQPPAVMQTPKISQP